MLSECRELFSLIKNVISNYLNMLEFFFSEIICKGIKSKSKLGNLDLVLNSVFLIVVRGIENETKVI